MAARDAHDGKAVGDAVTGDKKGVRIEGFGTEVLVEELVWFGEESEW